MNRNIPETSLNPSSSDQIQEGQGCEGNRLQELILVQVTVYRTDLQ